MTQKKDEEEEEDEDGEEEDEKRTEKKKMRETKTRDKKKRRQEEKKQKKEKIEEEEESCSSSPPCGNQVTVYRAINIQDGERAVYRQPAFRSNDKAKKQSHIPPKCFFNFCKISGLRNQTNYST